jgi:hypothetical protein
MSGYGRLIHWDLRPLSGSKTDFRGSRQRWPKGRVGMETWWCAPNRPSCCDPAPVRAGCVPRRSTQDRPTECTSIDDHDVSAHHSGPVGPHCARRIDDSAARRFAQPSSASASGGRSNDRAGSGISWVSVCTHRNHHFGEANSTQERKCRVLGWTGQRENHESWTRLGNGGCLLRSDLQSPSRCPLAESPEHRRHDG